MVACIEQLYKMCFAAPPSDEAKATMQAYLDDHDREKKGNQPRSLQDFHLTEEDVAFAEYSKMFLNG